MNALIFSSTMNMREKNETFIFTKFANNTKNKSQTTPVYFPTIHFY